MRSAVRWGAGSPPISSTTGASRSPSAANDSDCSPSAGCAASTSNPLAVARSTPADHSVVLPIPGSPSRKSARGPSAARKVMTAASSRSLPITGLSAVLFRMSQMAGRVQNSPSDGAEAG